MKLTIPPFEQARVVVIGDLMLDRYWTGATQRISPEAPVPVVRVQDIEAYPGGAGNVALNIAALGAEAAVDGIVGDDEPADILERLLRKSGAQCLFTRMPGISTITKLRVLSQHQQLIRLDFEKPLTGAVTQVLADRLRRHLPEIGAVVLSDYGKGSLGDVRELIRLARAADKPVLIDPKGTDFEKYRGATLLTPNLHEFEAVAGQCADEHELEHRAEVLREHLELHALLVTRGEHGMSLIRAGHAPLHLPARAREVYDVTGAGDTVIAVLATAVAAGQDLPEATALANLAAGIVVGKLGTASVSVAELREAIRSDAAEPVMPAGMLTEEALLTAVDNARALGERIVMTNGCFDILHAGHVRYLEQARRMGDRLIVAVNDDDSVRRLKGAGRPINPLAQRMEVLAALKSVDWVVPFAEDTPARLIGCVLPDFLVKGGDYRPEDIAGYDSVTASGGQVVVLDYHAGHSTSSIIDTVRRKE